MPTKARIPELFESLEIENAHERTSVIELSDASTSVESSTRVRLYASLLCSVLGCELESCTEVGRLSSPDGCVFVGGSSNTNVIYRGGIIHRVGTVKGSLESWSMRVGNELSSRLSSLSELSMDRNKLVQCVLNFELLAGRVIDRVELVQS